LALGQAEGVAVAIVLLAAGCSTWRPQEPSLDGWPLGAEGTCRFVGVDDDPRYDVALVASEALGVARKDVTEVRCYREGAYENRGEPYLVTRSGAIRVVVLTLTDGSRHAVGLNCVGGCRPARPPAGPSG
jgi:hypothetical protein